MNSPFTFLFALLTFYCSAQTNFQFSDSSAQWNLLVAGNSMWCTCYSYNTEVYTVVGIENRNGVDYQKLSDGSLLRKDSVGRVFCMDKYDTIHERLIYDFSKLKGDTFSLTNIWGNTGLDVRCKVDSVDSVYLGTTWRKRMYITYNGYSYFPDAWIDGIGSTKSHFLKPGIDFTLVDGDSYSMLCFFEKGSNLYHNPVDSSCLLDTIIYLSLPKFSNDLKLNIYPNPIVGNSFTIQVESNEFNGAVLQWTDLTGRLIFSRLIESKHQTIETPNLASGMYNCTIYVGEKRVARKKISVLNE